MGATRVGPQATREYLARMRERYERARREAKGALLVELCEVMGDHRKAAIRMTVCALIAATAAAQEPTIPDRVAASGGKPVTIGILRELSPIPIADLTVHADLIVEGRVARLKSYLSDDETRIYTDYRVVPNRFIVDRIKGSRPTPGAGLPLVFKVLGGELVLNGIRVTVVDSRRKGFREGRGVLLFLKKSSDGSGRFEPCAESAGMFEIEGQRVVGLLKDLDESADVAGIALEDVIEKIRMAAAQKVR